MASFLRRLQPVVSIAIVVAAAAFIARQVEWQDLSNAAQAADWRLAVPAFAMALTACAFRAFRLRLLLDNQPSLMRVFHIQNLGHLANLFLPLRGGELLMVILLGPASGKRRSETFSLVLIDRLIDLMAVVIVALVTVAQLPAVPDQISQLFWGVAIVGTASAPGVILLLHKREAILRICRWVLLRLRHRSADNWLERVGGVIDGVAVLARPKVMALAGLVSAAAWCAAIGKSYFCIAAFYPGADGWAAAFGICSALFGSVMITVPAGIGVIHAAMIFGLTTFKVPMDAAILAAILFHALMIFLDVVTGAIAIYALKIDFRGIWRAAPAQVPNTALE